MEIDIEQLTKFTVLAASCILGVAVVWSAVYIFHYASEQTKPTFKGSRTHFVLAWLPIIAVILFGGISVYLVVKYQKTITDRPPVIKALQEAAKKPMFNK